MDISSVVRLNFFLFHAAVFNLIVVFTLTLGKHIVHPKGPLVWIWMDSAFIYD